MVSFKDGIFWTFLHLASSNVFRRRPFNLRNLDIVVEIVLFYASLTFWRHIDELQLVIMEMGFSVSNLFFYNVQEDFILARGKKVKNNF